jgi:hypothetical protein
VPLLRWLLSGCRLNQGSATCTNTTKFCQVDTAAQSPRKKGNLMAPKSVYERLDALEVMHRDRTGGQWRASEMRLTDRALPAQSGPALLIVSLMDAIASLYTDSSQSQ